MQKYYTRFKYYVFLLPQRLDHLNGHISLYFLTFTVLIPWTIPLPPYLVLYQYLFPYFKTANFTHCFTSVSWTTVFPIHILSTALTFTHVHLNNSRICSHSLTVAMRVVLSPKQQRQQQQHHVTRFGLLW